MKDPIVEKVRQELLERSQLGISKYGTTLARKDLTLKEWLQHSKEEKMDDLLYTQRLIHELEELEKKGTVLMADAVLIQLKPIPAQREEAASA